MDSDTHRRANESAPAVASGGLRWTCVIVLFLQGLVLTWLFIRRGTAPPNSR